MNRTVSRFLWLVGACAVAAVGFLVGRATARPRPVRDDSTAVARYSGGVVTQREVLAAADTMGVGARARLATIDSRRQFVIDLVRRRMLADDARAQGDEQRPEIQSRIEQLLADERVKRTVDDALKAPTDSELKAYFEQHEAEYARPTRTRLAIIFIAAPPEGPDRAKKEREASALLKDVQAKAAHDFYAFATLARARTDDAPSRAFGGELPPMTDTELSKRLPAVVVEAAQTVTTPGQVFEHVVTAPAGFYIVKLVQHDAAVHPTIEGLKDTLRHRMLAEKRQTAYQKLLADVDTRAHVQLDEKSLAEVPTLAGTVSASQ